MEKMLVLKAIADENRMNILTLLLQNNYCVRALAKKMKISEAAVSQHLKILRDAEVVVGVRKGYFVHYCVNGQTLRALAEELEKMSLIEQGVCMPAAGGCKASEHSMCHNLKDSRCAKDIEEKLQGQQHFKHSPCKGMCHKGKGV
jgi:ArsR family transcriptional regulator, arsenate/arsenite/antimonite-responsive transcriptional repressor